MVERGRGRTSNRKTYSSNNLKGEGKGVAREEKAIRSIRREGGVKGVEATIFRKSALEDSSRTDRGGERHNDAKTQHH